MSTATIPRQPQLFDRGAAIRDYQIKMVAAVRQYEDQKAIYEALQAAYVKPDRPPETAKGRADGDPRTADAGRRAEWFRAEASMYGTAVLALRGDPR